MKKKFTKILGVGLTLALLCSLLLTAAPVSALSVPSVTVSPTTISAVDAEYNIRFELDKQLNGDITTVTTGDGAYDLADSGDSFVITATVAGDATVSETNGTVAVATTGAATVAYTSPTHTITFTASGETATVTVLKGDTTTGICDGDWAEGTATASATVGVGSTAADTITIVFDTDTAVTTDPTVTLVAGPGWINEVWVNATTTALTSTEIAGTVDTSTVVITLPATTKIGEGAEVRLSFTAGITNPDAAGDYNLTVETSKEDAVTSADYEIEVPDIGVLPGVVQQFNAVGVLMAQDTGDDAINTMVDTAAADYTIVVGPGEYEITDTIALDQAGLTLESSAGADDTILVAAASLNADVILITVADVTVDGFTIQDTEGAYTAIKVTTGGDDVTVINNVMTDTAEAGYPEGISIEGSATGATVTGNELDIYHTMMVQETASGCTLSDNTFGAGVNLHNTVSDITITGNTLIGVELWGIVLWSDGTYTDILIEGNTISETTEAPAIGIYIKGNAIINNLQILGNDITDNEGVGILIDSDVAIDTGSAIAIKFNTITGNDADTDGYGIQNDGDTAVIADVDATFNWWGTSVADDVAAMVNDADLGVTTYEPFLADSAEAVFSVSDVAVGETSLDAKTTVGVRVEDATGANVIVASKYIANPQAAIDDAIAFYDVYVAGADADVTPTIKFYAGDDNSKLYVWSADTEAWADLSEEESFGFSVYGGYIYIDYDAELLDETPFAVVGGAGADLVAPEILAPTTGDDTVSLTPIFAWEAATGADGYNFQLADNANFVTPMVKLDGDLGRLVVNAYAYVGELPYSTAYYWRVQAVSGTVAAGDLGESPWSTGVFITMDEPAEELPPVVVQEQPPVIIEPIVEVITPAATEITPAWIYVIIGVGAVLVIALLVLIVRTRRVA